MVINIKKKLNDIYNEYLRNNCFIGSTYMFFDRLIGHQIEKKRFLKNKGYSLDLKNPVSFSEKVVWKKLYDRNPLLTFTADKYNVRSYIKTALGEDEANEILVPLLFVTDNPENIPFDTLPARYIIKTNHGSGWNIIVNGTKPEPKKIISTCKKWLKQCYGLYKNEWAYKNIEKKILVEELMVDGKGEIPKDYKFFVFHGVCRKIMVFSNRHTSPSKTVLSFDRNWNRQLSLTGGQNIESYEKPGTYERMVNLAEKLGEDFDFVRVDLYTIDNNIYFGELTHYPMSGYNLPSPREKDVELGKYWHLERNDYWRKKSKKPNR